MYLIFFYQMLCLNQTANNVNFRFYLKQGYKKCVSTNKSQKCNRRLTWEKKIIEKNIHSIGKTQENIRMCFNKKKVEIIRDRETNG